MQKQPTPKLGHQQDPPARRDASKMAKNPQSGYKSKLKLKSTRKPLREVVNGVKMASLNQPTLNKNNTRINKNQNEEERDGNESLDRLLLIHSDLSSLIHQVIY